MPANSPRVSVLMPVFNGGAYLSEAIDSILRQTFTDFEFLIVDDGSTDGSERTLARYAAEDVRIQLLKNGKEKGIVGALNTGLGEARGEYIARMDADDVSLGDRLATQVRFLDDHPEIGVAGSAVRLIDTEGNEQGTLQFPQSHGVLKWLLCFFFNPIVHPTTMMRRELLTSVAGYRESYRHSEDYDLWCRICSLTRLGNIPRVLVLLRKHTGNVSNVHSERQAENALKVAGELIAKVSPETPRENLVGLWKTTFHPESASRHDVRRGSRFVQQVLARFLKNEALTPDEQREIRKDALLRLKLLMNHQESSQIVRIEAFARNFVARYRHR